jgi:hypothetical protein
MMPVDLNIDFFEVMSNFIDFKLIFFVACGARNAPRQGGHVDGDIMISHSNI